MICPRHQTQEEMKLHKPIGMLFWSVTCRVIADLCLIVKFDLTFIGFLVALGTVGQRAVLRGPVSQPHPCRVAAV